MAMTRPPTAGQTWRHPGTQAGRQLTWRERLKYPTDGVVPGNAVAQFQIATQPAFARASPVLYVIPPLRLWHDRAQCQNQYVEQVVVGAACNPRVLQLEQLLDELFYRVFLRHLLLLKPQEETRFLSRFYNGFSKVVECKQTLMLRPWAAGAFDGVAHIPAAVVHGPCNAGAPQGRLSRRAAGAPPPPGGGPRGGGGLSGGAAGAPPRWGRHHGGRGEAQVLSQRSDRRLRQLLFAQPKALDLSGGGLGQLGHELDEAGVFVRRQALLDKGLELVLRGRLAVLEHDEGHGFGQTVRILLADHRRLQNRSMLHQGGLDLERRDIDATDFEHVVAAPGVGVIAFGVAQVLVATLGPDPLKSLAALVALVPVHQRGTGALDVQVANRAIGHLAPVFAAQRNVVAGHRLARGAIAHIPGAV